MTTVCGLMKTGLIINEPITVYLRGGAVIKGFAYTTDEETLTINEGGEEDPRSLTYIAMSEVAAITVKA